MLRASQLDRTTATIIVGLLLRSEIIIYLRGPRLNGERAGLRI